MATSKRAGNFVSEWYGQRIYPDVRLDVSAVSGRKAGKCPFLSGALHQAKDCVKNENSKGVCTISSASNGARQDWLVCPYRVIKSTIVTESCQLIFGLQEPIEPVPVSILQSSEQVARLLDSIDTKGAGYVFFQDKLGGEISLVGTSQSPELAFDVTVVEIRRKEGGLLYVSRYGILEIQTMDYHGTYKHAVRNLREGLRMHLEVFPEALRSHLDRWSGEGVEGPNIANVFKRTFYQMLVKFRLAGSGSAAAGTVLAIPQSVWDSWQPFLGAPTLEEVSPDIKRLRATPTRTRKSFKTNPSQQQLNAYICVFDLDAQSSESISPVVIRHFVRVSPEDLTQYAFDIVPKHILDSMKSSNAVVESIKTRLKAWWPAFESPKAKARSRRRA